MNRMQSLREKMARLIQDQDKDGVPKNLAEIALTHWEMHRPLMFAKMKKDGTLQAKANEAEKSTRESMAAMIEAGMKPWEAWEEAREYAILLPEEETEEPEDEVEREMREDFEMIMEGRRLIQQVKARQL